MASHKLHMLGWVCRQAEHLLTTRSRWKLRRQQLHGRRCSDSSQSHLLHKASASFMSFFKASAVYYLSGLKLCEIRNLLAWDEWLMKKAWGLFHHGVSFCFINWKKLFKNSWILLWDTKDSLKSTCCTEVKCPLCWGHRTIVSSLKPTGAAAAETEANKQTNKHWNGKLPQDSAKSCIDSCSTVLEKLPFL